MFKWFLKFLGFLEESKLQKTSSERVESNNISSGISFPEYDPEEYQRQKAIRNDKALNGCEFWDGLNIDFQENLEFLNNRKCPYCGCDLPERKGQSYKCPECKEKIYRLKDLVSNFEGLFTQEQKEIREQLKKELNRRKRFWGIYQNAKSYINFEPIDLKNDNIVILLGLLSEAKKYITKASQLNALRMCRFYEGELCMNIDGYEKAGLNAYLAVAYIDLWGGYNNLFSDEDFTREELLEDGYTEFWDNGRISPYIIEQIKKFNYDINILKDLFLFNSKMITKTIKYKAPITPEDAWKKFKEYL